MAKKLMKGNEAIAEAAICAGAVHFFAYPITPQNEVGEYLSWRLPEVGGQFVQAESEVAVANMLFGAAASGKRVFTTSSSPGISLMQESISYMAGAHLPCVIVNIMRGGPGLGGILPAQSDYFQATKGGGHGDYRIIVLAPSSVQEAVDLMMLAFDLADCYRTPVMMIGDGMIGQMMESVEFPQTYQKPSGPEGKPWSLTGAKGRPPNVIKSLFLDPKLLEKNSFDLAATYEQIKAKEIRYELYKVSPQNRVLITAYGTMARICQTVIDELNDEGVSVGLFRPITLFPFPEKAVHDEATRNNIESVLTVEMSMGQMIEDIDRCLKGKKPLHFYGRTGGIVPSPDEVKAKIREILKVKA